MLESRVGLSQQNPPTPRRKKGTLALDTGVTRLISRRPGDIITPSLIRFQAEQKLVESKQGNAVKVQESQISKYYSTLPPLPNITIPNCYIVKNPKEYQAHLQAIGFFRDQTFTISDQAISKKKNNTFSIAGRNA